jgi:glycosyltransferase involved in cell wall biosynthesis
MGHISFLSQVTPVILTFNEEANISRVLEMLDWAREIVVVDSGSTDSTLNILGSYPKVRCVHRSFDTHAEQWQFAIAQTRVSTEWILALDADYVLTPELLDELDRLTPPKDMNGYVTRFRYCIEGTPLRGTLYPPVTTLYRLGAARYVQTGHTQRVQVEGNVGELAACIHHDDRKPLSRWLWAQDRYATLEAAALSSVPWMKLRMQDKLRRLVVVTPLLVPIYCLVVRGNLLDGRRGIYYALQRAIAEAVLSLKLIQSRFN